jgi:hypothetical protein
LEGKGDSRFRYPGLLRNITDGNYMFHGCSDSNR